MRCEAQPRSEARRTDVYVERASEVATKQIAKRASPKKIFLLNLYIITRRSDTSRFFSAFRLRNGTETDFPNTYPRGATKRW